MSASEHVVDVTDASFPAAVLEESKRRPVVVDFWAPWCAPCRALSPLLDRLADEGAGRFVVAKVNTDDNPAFAGQLGVRGIPAVFALKDGQVVDSFVGAQPEAEVRKFLERVAPSPIEASIRAALAAVEARDDAKAPSLLAEARAAAPKDARVVVALALVDARAGRLDDARAQLDAVGFIPDALTRLAAQARALIEAGGGDVDTAAAAVAASPTDVDAILKLAALRYARGEPAASFEALLDGITRVKGGGRDALRKRMVELFDAVGTRDPIVEDARARLARLWFS